MCHSTFYYIYAVTHLIQVITSSKSAGRLPLHNSPRPFCSCRVGEASYMYMYVRIHIHICWALVAELLIWTAGLLNKDFFFWNPKVSSDDWLFFTGMKFGIHKLNSFSWMQNVYKKWQIGKRIKANIWFLLFWKSVLFWNLGHI